MLRVIKGPLKLRASTNYPHAVCEPYGLINIRLCCVQAKEAVSDIRFPGPRIGATVVNEKFSFAIVQRGETNGENVARVGARAGKIGKRSEVREERGWAVREFLQFRCRRSRWERRVR